MPVDRLLLASYRGPARGFTSKAAGVLVVRGIAGKLAYLRAMALPQRSYLERRGLRLGGHWRRAAPARPMTATAYHRADVPWRRSLNAVLCLPPDATEPVTLAGTGPEVWDLLQRPYSLAELAAELAARHQTDAEAVASDIRPGMEELAVLGLVEPVF